MLALFERFRGYLVAALTGLAAVAMIYLRGRSVGKAEARQDQQAKTNEQAAQARQKAQEVHDAVDAMDDAAIRAESKRDWVQRGPGKR